MSRLIFNRRIHVLAKLVAACPLFLAVTVLAQNTEWEVPRTVDGQPDLQGVWANNTITPVERPDYFENQEFLTEDQMAFLRRRVTEIQDEDGDALFGSGVFDAAFSGEIVSYDPTTGNYDQSWLAERSVHNRTSQIIDPPDGRYPPRAESRGNVRLRNNPPWSYLDFSSDDRCISYGAPYLNAGYNSYWQIVQSRDYVVIIQEMIHDARVIPLFDQPPLDEKIGLWHGDSKAYWEGDTLVVETVSFSGQSSFGHNRSRKNIERFTRIAEDQLRYQLTADQPDTFTAPYTREIMFDYSPGPIYEYACHEGNYAMTNILRGARVQERLQQEAEDEN